MKNTKLDVAKVLASVQETLAKGEKELSADDKADEKEESAEASKPEELSKEDSAPIPDASAPKDDAPPAPEASPEAPAPDAAPAEDQGLSPEELQAEYQKLPPDELAMHLVAIQAAMEALAPPPAPAADPMASAAPQSAPASAPAGPPASPSADPLGLLGKAEQRISDLEVRLAKTEEQFSQVVGATQKIAERVYPLRKAVVETPVEVKAPAVQIDQKEAVRKLAILQASGKLNKSERSLVDDFTFGRCDVEKVLHLLK